MNPQKTLPDHLWKAYLNTDYSFTDGARTIVMRLGEPNLDLLAYLEQEQIIQWAYLTAWNPYSIEQLPEYNRQQQLLLLEELKGNKVCKGEGKGRGGDWPGEESYFVPGISRTEAIALGRLFGQNAILVSGENLEPELVIL